MLLDIPERVHAANYCFFRQTRRALQPQYVQVGSFGRGVVKLDIVR